MSRFRGGDIVIVDWRGDGLRGEPNKLRPAVVVDDETLFSPDYPFVIVVPLTTATDLTIDGLCVSIDPTPENGCTARSYVLVPFITAAAVARVRPTGSRVEADQLRLIRQLIAEAIGAA